MSIADSGAGSSPSVVIVNPSPIINSAANPAPSTHDRGPTDFWDFIRRIPDEFVETFSDQHRVKLEGWDMWYHIFSWCILSALVLHIIAALIAFCRLHPHRLSRICPILLLVFPMLTAIVCGSITALVVKAVHELIDVDMSPIWACFWGLGQTLFTTILNFHRFSSLL